MAAKFGIPAPAASTSVISRSTLACRWLAWKESSDTMKSALVAVMLVDSSEGSLIATNCALPRMSVTRNSFGWS